VACRPEPAGLGWISAQPPAPGHEAYRINVEALGRLFHTEQFGDIVVKSIQERVIRMRHHSAGRMVAAPGSPFLLIRF